MATDVPLNSFQLHRNRSIAHSQRLMSNQCLILSSLHLVSIILNYCQVNSVKMILSATQTYAKTRCAKALK